MGKDELNALQYAGGFVSHSYLRDMKTRVGNFLRSMLSALVVWHISDKSPFARLATCCVGIAVIKFVSFQTVVVVFCDRVSSTSPLF